MDGCLASRPAHLWRLMVTKSRMSPFANTRGRKGRKKTTDFIEQKVRSKASNRSQKLKKWFSVVDAATLSRKRALLPVKKLRSSLLANSKLHRTLYGFIVFQVVWKDVRGINYLNEHQSKFIIHPDETSEIKNWIFHSMGKKCRTFKGSLKTRGYDPSLTVDEILTQQTNNDNRVNPTQFKEPVTCWFTPEFQAMDNNGVYPKRGELYVTTHTCKD